MPATLLPLAELKLRLGISRLADQTGLDRIGLPVFAAIRPMARNLAVSFGKGLTRETAMISALMEAAELAYAEVEPPNLDRGTIAGHALLSGEPRLVPWRQISMDLSQPAASRLAKESSGTGLAAHWNRDEAILHGLLEVIERDAHQAWNEADDVTRASSLIDIGSVHMPAAHDLIERIRAARVEILAWRLSPDGGVPCHLVELFDTAPHADAPYVQGAAAHPHAATALLKALMEAVQIRLTYIAGSRDDLDEGDYGDRYAPMIRNRQQIMRELKPACRLVEEPLPARSARDMARDLAMTFGEAADPIVVDLVPPDAGLSVVKVIVPESRDLPDAGAHADANRRWLEAVS
jgi:YcaO-like protein with predicted kinase domain